MANAVITVLEADGVTETDVTVLDVGRQAAAASKSVTTATEDKAVLDAIAASLALLDNSIAAGNELQVDIVGALPAGSANIGDVDIASIAAGDNNIGNVDIASIAAGDNNIGNVDIVTVIAGTGATNLGKAVDSAAGATDTGVAMLAIRDDTLGALTPAESDYVHLRVNSTGALHVTGAGGGTQYTEGDTDATIIGTAVMWEDASDVLTSVRTGKPLPIQIRSSSGTEASVLTTVAHDEVDAGDPMKIGGYAKATAPTAVNADGDRVNAWYTLNGAMVATVYGGLLAHSDVDAGNPVKIGAKAVAGVSGATMVSAADRTDAYAGIDGVLYVRPHCGLEDLITPLPVEITDGSSTSIVASAGAGVKNYITTVIISNTSASFVEVDLRDGAAGTVRATFPVPATSGVVCNFPVPLPFSAATAVCADPSAAASTITVTCHGFKSKV